MMVYEIKYLSIFDYFMKIFFIILYFIFIVYYLESER